MWTILWILVFIVMCGTPSLAATRLGLHTTQEELNLWRQRMVNGPYKTTGDVSTNSPGDWDRISANAEAFRSSPTAGIWAGPAGSTCVSGSQHAPPLNEPRRMRDAAFKALLTVTSDPSGSADLKVKARDWILSQQAQAGTDFTNTTKWCAQNSASDYLFTTTEWMIVILFAMDYLEILDSNTFTSTQKTSLQNWFVAFGTMSNSSIRGALLDIFPGRESDNYTPAVGTENPSSFPVILYHEVNGTAGPSANSKALRYWANKKNTVAHGVANIGVRYNVSDFKTHMERYGKEVVKYSLWPQGVTTDFFRCYDSPTSPERALGYAGTIVGDLVGIAEVFGRNGDLDLYNYVTAEGIFGSEGGSKSVRFAVESLMKYVDHTFDRYCTDGANGVAAGNPDYRIDDQWSNLNCSGCLGKQSLRTLFLVPANNFYKSSYIKGVYRRTGPGMIPFPTLANSINGSYEMQGVTQAFPGVLFMFGDMADDPTKNLDPYNQSVDTTVPNPPTGLTVTCSGSPSQCLVSATKAANNTDASSYTDPLGYRVRYCPNAGCSTASGTVVNVSQTGNLVTQAITGLADGTLYRMDIASVDTANHVSTFTATQQDTTVAAAAPALIAQWTMDTADISGTALNDETGNGRTGVIAGTPAGETGEIAQGLVFDGVNDAVRVTRVAALEPTPGAITVCAWAKRTGDQPGNVYYLIDKTYTNDLGFPYASYALRVNDNSLGSGVITWLLGFSGTERLLLQTDSSVLPDGVYTHICGRYNPIGVSPQAAIFVGGAFVKGATETRSLFYDTTTTGDLYLGFNGGTRYWRGSLDDVRIYAGALPDADIAQLAVGSTGSSGVYSQPASWCWRDVDQLENGTFQRSTCGEGRLVVNNQVRLRTVVSRTVDTGVLQQLALYCRVPAGTGATEDWWALNDDCVGHRFCYGFDQRLATGVLTTPQRVAANVFTPGGKVYEAFGARDDQVSIAGDTSIEREHVLRVRSDQPVNTTVGCCERLGDGTVLNSCAEATARVVAPGGYTR
jgi:hypothetical protein